MTAKYLFRNLILNPPPIEIQRVLEEKTLPLLDANLVNTLHQGLSGAKQRERERARERAPDRQMVAREELHDLMTSGMKEDCPRVFHVFIITLSTYVFIICTVSCVGRKAS